MKQNLFNLYEKATTIQDIQRFEKKISMLSLQEMKHQASLFREYYGCDLWDACNKKKRAINGIVTESAMSESGDFEPMIEDVVFLNFGYCIENTKDILERSLHSYLLESELQKTNITIVESVLLQQLLEKNLHPYSMKEKKATPFFRPDEMEELGVFSHDSNAYGEADNTTIGNMSTKEWFEHYKNTSGIATTSETYTWVQKMKQLYTNYDSILESGDEQKISARKQSILELGWNPEINFSEKAAILVSARHNKFTTNFANVSEFNTYTDTDDKIKLYSSELKPIFVNVFSKYSSDMHKSNFSYTTFSFDPSMNRLHYIENGILNSERIDDFIKHHPHYFTDDITLSVFVAFVTINQYNKIMDLFIYGDNHKNYDKYHMNDIIKTVTRADDNDITIFVERIVNMLMKLVNMKVDAENDQIRDTYIADVKDPIIYMIYEGKTDDYNINTAIQMVNDLIEQSNNLDIQANADDIREMVIYGTTIGALKESVSSIDNLRKILTPSSILQERVKDVDADDDGTIIIHTVEDVNTEFFKCHRNLMSFEKAKNYESMKDELCKLKYIDNYAVRHMKNKKSRRYKEYADAHARITNDFNKYLTMVTEYDPTFNFVKYYEASRWHDDEIRLSKNVINIIIDILKNIIF